MMFAFWVVVVFCLLLLGVIVLDWEGRRHLRRARKELKGPDSRDRIGL